MTEIAVQVRARPRSRLYIYSILSLLLLLAITGGAVYVLRSGEVQRPSARASGTRPTPVHSEAARLAPVTDELPAYGNLRPRLQVNIVAPQAGQLHEILFSDGSTVPAGTPLATMDDRVARAQLEAARARFLADQENLTRVRNLARQGLESTYSVEQARSSAAASLFEQQASEATLELTTLRAPFAGTLGTRRVDPGAMLNVGDKIVSIEDRSRMFVEIRLASRNLPLVHPGMEVLLSVPSLSADLGAGQVTMVDNSVSADTRSILVRAEIDNIARQLPSGLFVRAVLQLATQPNAIVVPDEAVMHDLLGAYVFVVEENVARRRSVQLGVLQNGIIEITQGLKAGEQVVTVGAFRLHDGDSVTEMISGLPGHD